LRGATLAPADSEAQSQLARVQMIQGDLQAARYPLNRAPDADPAAFSPCYLRGVIFMRIKAAAKAEKARYEAAWAATREGFGPRLFRVGVSLDQRVQKTPAIEQ